MADDEPATTTPPITAAASTKNVVHWQEVQDTVSRLASHKGVLAVSILNSKGNIVTHQVTTAGAERARSSEASGSGGSGTAAPSILGNPHLLTRMMKSANQYVLSLSGPRGEDGFDGDDEDNENDDDASGASAPSRSNSEESISFVRIRTRKDEILVAPKLGYTLVVLQDPSISAL